MALPSKNIQTETNKVVLVCIFFPRFEGTWGDKEQILYTWVLSQGPTVWFLKGHSHSPVDLYPIVKLGLSQTIGWNDKQTPLGSTYICTFGYGFGIRSKAKCFSGQIFGFSLKWKPCFRSFTAPNRGIFEKCCCYTFS